MAGTLLWMGGHVYRRLASTHRPGHRWLVHALYGSSAEEVKVVEGSRNIIVSIAAVGRDVRSLGRCGASLMDEVYKL